MFAVWPAPALAANPRPKWNPGVPWAPLHPHSGEMTEISNLFWIMLAISAIVFIGVSGAIVISIFRFSAKPGDPEPRQIAGDRRLETLWTVIPFVILIFAFSATIKAITDINTPPKGSHPLDIVAMGHQWWWEFDYPSYRITTANEMHVPAGVPLHIHVESYDVIHSFWVPQLARQLDANPGQDNPVYVEMNQPGVYAGACYEYCGTAHAWMKFETVVEPKGEFDAWVKHMQSNAATPAGGEAAQGEKVFMAHTCIDCHAINFPGSVANGGVGPNLTHVGSRWTIGAGAAPVSVATLMQWVHDPSSFKPGVNMPPYALLNQKDLKALATYLYSLK
jgi:cytochrome c oxidase subunit 2